MATKPTKARKATAKTTKATAKVKATKALEPCQCNTTQVGTEAGEPVFGPCGEKTKREFAPGHDARLKGTLIRLHVAGQKYRVRGQKPVTAMEAARQRQWGGFLTKASERATARAQATEARVAARRAESEARAQAKADRQAQAQADRLAKAEERAAAKEAAQAAKAQAAPARPAFNTEPGSRVNVKVGRHQYTGVVTGESANGVTVDYTDTKGNNKTVTVKRTALSAAA